MKITFIQYMCVLLEYMHVLHVKICQCFSDHACDLSLPIVVHVCSLPTCRLCCVKDSVTAAFTSAGQYADTFETYRQFYSENEALDLEAVKQGHHGMMSDRSTGRLMLCQPIYFYLSWHC